MKWQVAAVLSALAVYGCAAPEHRYVGSPSSAYDKERDPPFVVQKDSYDPMAPIQERDYGNSGSPAPLAAPVTLTTRPFSAQSVHGTENLLDVRQTRFDPLVLPRRAPDGRWTVDAWGPADGFVLNGGVH